MSRSFQRDLERYYFVINESLNLLPTKKCLESTEYGSRHLKEFTNVWNLSKEKLPYLTSISSYVVVVKDVKGCVIVLKKWCFLH